MTSVHTTASGVQGDVAARRLAGTALALLAVAALLGLVGCAAKPTEAVKTTSAQQQSRVPAVSEGSITTFTAEAGTADVDGSGKVYVTLEDGARASLPFSGTLRVGDVLEYEKHVSATGDVSVRFVRNLSDEARQEKKETASLTPAPKNGQVAGSSAMAYTSSAPLAPTSAEKLRAFVRAKMKRKYGYVPYWAESGSKDDIPVQCFWVNCDEVQAAVERNKKHMDAGEPKEPLPDNAYQYVVTWGVDGYKYGNSRELVYYDGIWYVKAIADTYPGLLKVTRRAIADGLAARPGDVPKGFTSSGALELFN